MEFSEYEDFEVGEVFSFNVMQWFADKEGIPYDE